MTANDPIQPTDVDRIEVETNGITLHVVTAGPPDGRPVVLLHGFPEFWYGWRHQIRPLAEAGFRLWIPDQRGYNLSDKPRSVEAYTVDVLVRDVLGLADSMGAQTVSLVGHDWGGVIGWLVATDHPERVDRLVAMNAPHPSVFRDFLASHPGQMLRSGYMAFFQLPRLPELLFSWRTGWIASRILRRSGRVDAFSDDELARYRRSWGQPGAPTGMINWYRALLRFRPRLPRAPVVGPSTLLIWGTEDRFLRREMVRPSIGLCTDGRAKFVGSATHWVQHEEAGQVNAAMVEFLGRSN